MKSSSENIQIKPSRKKNESKVNIILENDLSIYSIHELKEKIIKVYSKYDEIIFEIKDVKNIDLTLIQFLHSIKETALLEKKKISIKTAFEKDIELLMNNADINKVFKII